MDTGDYQCNITVSGQQYSQPLILPSSNTATTSLNVTGIDLICSILNTLYFPIVIHDSSADVNTSTVGSTEAGQTISESSHTSVRLGQYGT